ncbi:hypothetical protein JMN12_10200 [Capnocytophaga genosp. AHN8471]|uniref:hypothetical protein n=1 Tax=Capnocytophaga genosp. AHN8471 TaxID=327574 RepID=UPI0019331492|nr:hypothetical protein [Capnocytophaga genosp. AHN8471]MBM0656912.1 hypothetical protein [Capnocytophaga genosp. AHN8471]
MQPSVNNIVEICVPLIIILLGTAYPIILNNISNIGEKYHSKYIIALFKQERFYNQSSFQWILYLSLFLLFLLIFKFEPLFGWDNWFINNSANILVFLVTALLLFIFSKWIKKISIYNSNIDNLLDYIIKRYESSNGKTKEYAFMSINDIAIYAVNTKDIDLQSKLLKFYFNYVIKYRKEYNNTDKELNYDEEFSGLIRRIIDECVENNYKDLLPLRYSAINGELLIPYDTQDIKISENTYNNLWYNITLIRNNTYYISKFWAYSNQYFWTGLKEIALNFDRSNEKEFIEREEERKRFLEFHYAVGGLLLYSKNYEALKYIFSYSQQSTPDYKLLPYNMKQIFEWIEFFRNEYKRIPIFIIGFTRYQFPNLDSAGTNRQVVFWICRYLCVLFIRQYKLLKTLYYSNTTNQPYLYDLSLMELYNWKESITYFKFCLNKVLEDKEALEQLELWNTYELKYSEIDKFIIELEQSIDERISDKKKRAELSQEKIKQFYASSKKILENCLEEYLPINNPEDFDTDFKVTFLGQRTLSNKSFFVDDDIPCMGFDSSLADFISSYSIPRDISNSFLIAKTNRYLLNNNNLLEGMDRVIQDKEDIVIIVFSGGYETTQKIENSKYKENIIYLPAIDFKNTIFILEKSNLPKIEKSDISEEVKQELQVKKISDKWNIYGTVIDINLPENEAIKEKWIDDINYYQKENKLQILLGLLFVGHIKFKSDRKIIQININNEFEELGTENKLSDLEPL